MDSTCQTTIHTQLCSSDIFVQHDENNMTQHGICKDTDAINYTQPRMRTVSQHELNTRYVRQIISANYFKTWRICYNLQRTARAFTLNPHQFQADYYISRALWTLRELRGPLLLVSQVHAGTALCAVFVPK